MAACSGVSFFMSCRIEAKEMIARHHIAALPVDRLLVFPRRTIILVLLVLAILAFAGNARAQSQFDVLYTFPSKGVIFPTSLIKGNDGNFYGTTPSIGDATVFKITPSGTFTILHTFDPITDPFSDPSAVTQATDGNLYGSKGSKLFQLTPTGTLQVLHTLDPSEGSYPSALIQGTDGNFYGTTNGGGSVGAGTVFSMTSSGSVTVLHAFSTDDYIYGCNPNGPLIQGTDGNFYGATSRCGSGSGTIFRITPSGSVDILQLFGAYTLIQGTDGNFYGIAGNTIFRMNPDSTVTNLYTFGGGNDGNGPNSLMQASNGNFYGTTTGGGGTGCGGGGCGTAFQMTPSGSLTILHAFAGGMDGAYPDYPRSPLIQAVDGNFYGTTQDGGTGCGNVGCGAIFRMSPSGVVTVVHAFTNTSDGVSPSSPLIQATDGNFYGTTGDGGILGFGTVFTMTPSGTATTLHSFTGTTEGAFPNFILQATDGNFYGTTDSGGSTACGGYGCGTVFRMTPGGAVTSLHGFTTGSDGAEPGSLIQATDGNLYGTTYYGGALAVFP